jgi:HK97 gp10 family phage protein
MSKQFDVKVKGLDDFTRAIHAQAEKLDRASESIVKKGAAIVGSEAKKEFRPRPLGSTRTSKTGRVYYSSKPPFQPRPTAPTSRTGNLRNSIHMIEAKRIGPGKWMSSTGPTMMYGAMVENGTTRSRAFPYMEPGLKKSAPQLESLYSAEWRKALA